MRPWVATAVLVCVLSPGCGYRLADRGGPRTSVNVETWQNDSLEPGVELVLAAALRREIARSERLRVVEGQSASAVRVAGRVVAVETANRTYTPGVRALEFALTVRVELSVTGAAGRPIPIDPFAQSATEVYLASTDVQIVRKNRDEALRRVAALLATRIRREIERVHATPAEAATGSPAARRGDPEAAASGARGHPGAAVGARARHHGERADQADGGGSGVRDPGGPTT